MSILCICGVAFPYFCLVLTFLEVEVVPITKLFHQKTKTSIENGKRKQIFFLKTSRIVGDFFFLPQLLGRLRTGVNKVSLEACDNAKSSDIKRSSYLQKAF